MGSRYLFTCRRCGFEATVSGGFDVGFACATHTYACRDCGVLFDRAISDAPWAFDREEVPPKFTCPENPNQTSHQAELWCHPGPCPKCGETLGRTERCVLCWD